jgi:nitrite reductase (NADH) small subunit
MRWVSLGALAPLQFAPGARVKVEERELAVFRLRDGGFCAVVDSCPHAGAALSEGIQEGDELTCTWHGWRFDLRTGRCSTVDEDCVQVHPVREVEGELFVGL